jgi:hypothetical protein
MRGALRAVGVWPRMMAWLGERKETMARHPLLGLLLIAMALTLLLLAPVLASMTARVIVSAVTAALGS